jgi:hypothetical protein
MIKVTRRKYYVSCLLDSRCKEVRSEPVRDLYRLLRWYKTADFAEQLSAHIYIVKLFYLER